MKFSVLVVVAFLGVASASVESDSPCRLEELSPRVKTGFQLSAYLGTWYEDRRYEAANQVDFDCVMARYTSNVDGSVQVANSGYAPGGNFVEFIGNAVVSFPEQTPLPAKLDVFFFEGQPTSIYWVLSTDYSNYAVVWSCAELPNGRSREQAWILSRTPELNANATIRVDEVIALNNLVPEAFRPTSQDLGQCRGKCPNDDLSCDNNTKCIPFKLQCNFDRDCQDGEDENWKHCGRFYGSQEVLAADFDDGMRVNNALNKTYNFANFSEMLNFCSYAQQDIPEDCKCKKVNLVWCRNKTKIPRNFPRNVEMIYLRNNSITLMKNDSFEAYHNLSYLDLAHNNISEIPSDRLLTNLENLRKLLLQNNRIEKLPLRMFSDTTSLKWLVLNHNRLHFINLEMLKNLKHLQLLDLSNNKLSLEQAKFPELHALKELSIDSNLIENLTDSFENLSNLTMLSLRFNHIKVVKASTFSYLHRLQELRLSDNPIQSFECDFLLQMPNLNAIYLDNLLIPINEQLVSKLNVSYLSIAGIGRSQIDFKAIAQIENLKYIVFRRYSYCLMEPKLHVEVCRPKTDGISSTVHLLANPTLRYAAWMMILLTCIGNMMVLWGRFTSLHDENRSVSMVIRNLAVSDLIMGLYLIIISFQDYRYGGSYHSVSAEWVKSWGCTLAGILSMVSSEVSILILTFMSIERFLLISDPFGHHRLNTKNVVMSLYIIWLIGLSIAIFPVILFRQSTKFYGIYNGGTCFPLFIHDKFPSGWEYSAFVFLGINLTLLILISTLYTALLFSIYRTRRATTLDFFDCEFAIRFFFIVLTDSTCWAPIIILKFLAFTDFEVSGDAYAWLVVFVLPLNSAVNPLLYTFSTPKYRDQIYTTFSKQSFIKKQDSSSHQVTADDSQTKVLPILYKGSNSSSSWNFMRKKS